MTCPFRMTVSLRRQRASERKGERDIHEDTQSPETGGRLDPSGGSGQRDLKKVYSTPEVSQGILCLREMFLRCRGCHPGQKEVL